jgi:uncharacterized membrane protein YvbJ
MIASFAGGYMAFCTACGHLISDEDRFCSACAAPQELKTKKESQTSAVTSLLSVEEDASTVPVVGGRSKINQFQKNVLFIAVTAFVVGLAGFGINYSIQEHSRRVEEQKVQWKKVNIKVAL